MTDKNKTSILCILDRSGSMSSIKDDAIGGYNNFIENQKKEPGDAFVTTILFDHEYISLYENKNLNEIPKLTSTEFFPRGTTALYDAIGKGINTLGENLSKLEENDRPGTVIVLIITDGQENSSKEFSREKIKEMIKLQKEVYSWKFMFLCADESTLDDGVDLGFSRNLSFVYTTDSIGVNSNSEVYSCAVSCLRSGFEESSLNLQQMYDDIDSNQRS